MKKTALITGASSGIGKELAKIHAQNGGDLVLVARNQERLGEIREELKSTFDIEIITIVKDLSIVGSAKELYEEVKTQNIDIQYLFNNAGFGLRGEFWELPWDRQLQMINLNMIALSELTYLFLPDFIARNSGKILNTSSVASLVPGPLQAVYYASKAFVTSLSNALSEELRNTSITVTALLPGATDTGFAKTANMDKTKGFAKMVTPQSVAKDGYDAMIRGDLEVITGLTITQKFLTSLAPLFPKKMILKQVREFQEI